jgi:hypothetical protein
MKRVTTKKMNDTTRPLRRPLWAAGAILAASLCQTASAGMLEYSDVSVHVLSTCFGMQQCGPNNEGRDEDLLVLPQGDTTELQSLLQPDPTARYRFPTSTSALPGSFSSAAMSARDPAGTLAGVGVSGSIYGELHAQADYGQSVRNPGLESLNTLTRWTIPSIEMLIAHTVDFDGPPIDPTIASARAIFSGTRFNASGDMVEEFDIFSHVASLEKINYHNGLSSVDLRLSTDLEDLTSRFGNLRPVEQRLAGGTRVAGYVIDEFSGAYSARLGPSERLELTYGLEVFGYCSWPGSRACDDLTLFYQVRIGDPLDIQGSGAGFTIEVLNDASPVPEPASTLLLGCGLLMLFARQRR